MLNAQNWGQKRSGRLGAPRADPSVLGEGDGRGAE